MKERISMSTKELERLNLLEKVIEKRLTIAQAAEHIDLSVRHVKRLLKRLRLEGPKGLISKKVGAPGNHRLSDSIKEKAIQLVLTHYHDFGPTLAHEYLRESHGLQIGLSTIRHLMIANGIWQGKHRKKKRVFQLRERRSQVGELIQVDGSPEKWFEERGSRCTLLTFIDDATGAIQHAKFAESESLHSYFLSTKEYIELHGRPRALYTDKHSVFRVNQETVQGSGLTQFGRAMQELDIELICANTPQAKGRVERRHRDLQDRLIKAMRLQGISTIADANAFLPSFIQDFNKRFAKVPKNASNAHRLVSDHQDLNRIFSEQTMRRLSKNLILQYKNVVYQIQTERLTNTLKHAYVLVRESLEGNISIEYRGELLIATPYHEAQYRAEIVSAKELENREMTVKRVYKPKMTHPYKRKSFKRREAMACI